MDRHLRLFLWLILALLILLRLEYFFTQVQAGNYLLGLDDYTRYMSSVRLLLWKTIKTQECWLPFPIVAYGLILWVFSGRVGLCDIQLILAVNWLFYFATLAALVTGLRLRSLRAARPSNLMAAIAFAAIPFMHRLSLSTMSEPLCYLILVVFILAAGRAWITGRTGWRVLAAVCAAAWMLSRYEAWVAAGALVWAMGLVAWKQRRYPRPFLEPVLLSILPILWMLYFLVRDSNPLFFLVQTGKFLLGNRPSTLMEISESFLSNSLFAVLAGWALVIWLAHYRKQEKGRPGMWRRISTGMPLFSLAVAGVLFLFLAALLLLGRFGIMVPERFAIQVLVALSPFVGTILIHWIRGLSPSSTIRTLVILGIVLVSILLIELTKRPAFTFYPWQKPVMKTVDRIRSLDPEMIVIVPAHMDRSYVPPYLYIASYSINRTKFLEKNWSNDLLENPHYTSPRFFVIFDVPLKEIKPPPGFRAFQDRDAVVVWPESIRIPPGSR